MPELSVEILPVTVALCTRNRPDDLMNAVHSILEANPRPQELLIVDQSDRFPLPDSARNELLENDWIHYLSTETQGKSRALNLAVEAAKCDILVSTDDDCLVEPDWLVPYFNLFGENPQIGIAFGAVKAVEHDSSLGYIPVYAPVEGFLCKTPGEKWRARGIGANFAFRLSVAKEIGGFDEEIGPGSRFRSCEEGDFAVRVLLAGHFIGETPQSVVHHAGFRTWEEGRTLIRDAFYGIGASYIKPLKCRKRGSFAVLWGEFSRFALFPSLTATLTLQRPTNWSRVLSLLKGARDGWRTPSDPATLKYEELGIRD